jgi:hypothetical protein
MPTRQADWINQMNVWEFLEKETDKAEEVRALVNWSLNFNIRKGTPYQVFLDLIGHSEENLGGALVQNISDVPLGFVELDLIGDALKEYAKNPQDVTDWINELENVESKEFANAN